MTCIKVMTTYDDLGVEFKRFALDQTIASVTIDIQCGEDNLTVDAIAGDKQDAAQLLVSKLEAAEQVLTLLGERDAAHIVSEYNADIFDVWLEVELDARQAAVLA